MSPRVGHLQRSSTVQPQRVDHTAVMEQSYNPSQQYGSLQSYPTAMLASLRAVSQPASLARHDIPIDQVKPCCPTRPHLTVPQSPGH